MGKNEVWGKEMNWPTKKTVHEVERGSNLDLLLRGANGIGNRLVDALLAIATALSTPQDNSAEVQAHIDQISGKLKQQTDALNATVDHAEEK